MGCSWELLYADNLMINAESVEELLVVKVQIEDRAGEKGLRVNKRKSLALIWMG